MIILLSSRENRTETNAVVVVVVVDDVVGDDALGSGEEDFGQFIILDYVYEDFLLLPVVRIYVVDILLAANKVLLFLFSERKKRKYLRQDNITSNWGRQFRVQHIVISSECFFYLFI